MPSLPFDPDRRRALALAAGAATGAGTHPGAVEIVASAVGNVASPAHPTMEDVGMMVLRAGGVATIVFEMSLLPLVLDGAVDGGTDGATRGDGIAGGAGGTRGDGGDGFTATGTRAGGVASRSGGTCERTSMRSPCTFTGVAERSRSLPACSSSPHVGCSNPATQPLASTSGSS